MRASNLVPSAALILLTACGDEAATEDAGTVEGAASATVYMNLMDYLADADLDRWIVARSDLIDGFDRICGDTICSGDYSNLTTVSLSCSVTKLGHVKECTWVLGGSIEHVNGTTGTITAKPRVFECTIPVKTKLEPLLTTLETGSGGSLDRPLPGTGRSFYDGLVDCFDGVMGPPPPPETGTKFVELGEYEGLGFDWVAWVETRRALNQSFDDACADSFCEGEYNDISGLRLACSVNTATGKVSTCKWSFAGSYETVTKKGHVSAHTAKWTCRYKIDAPLEALTEALSGDDPLYAPLPNKTTSLYDGLIGCL